MKLQNFAFLPNLISCARLALAPLAVMLILSWRWAEALAVFAVAGASDGLDGFLARRFDWSSELGAFLDAAADKALLIGSYAALARVGALPTALALVVIGRDGLLALGALIASRAGRPMTLRPLKISKANTFAQICLALGLLVALAAGGAPFAPPWPGLWTLGGLMVAALTLASGAAYFMLWARHMRA